jgi:hypothetical protein
MDDQGSRVPFPAGDGNLSLSLRSRGYQGLFPRGKAARGVKATTRLHLVPRSKNEWSYTSTPLMAWCTVKNNPGTALILPLPCSERLWDPTYPIRWVPGAISVGVKRSGREADHSRPSSAEVQNAWSHTSTPQYVFMVWCLVKQRDTFTLSLCLSVKKLLFTQLFLLFKKFTTKYTGIIASIKKK